MTIGSRAEYDMIIFGMLVLGELWMSKCRNSPTKF